MELSLTTREAQFNKEVAVFNKTRRNKTRIALKRKESRLKTDTSLVSKEQTRFTLVTPQPLPHSFHFISFHSKALAKQGHLSDQKESIVLESFSYHRYGSHLNFSHFY